jgi:hypothetical protein
MPENTIRCELCGLVCKMQITASHLRVAHQMITKEYKALGYKTLSPARLEQILDTPLSKGEVPGCRGKYGPDHPNWKGGHVAKSGYRIVSKQGNSHLYEHRVIAEEMIGRPLAPGEIVHHKDGKRSNNSPDNLVVMQSSEHDKIKDGVRARFHTSPDCEEAAQLLHSLGWSNVKIQRALRIHHGTLDRWLSKLD